MSPTEAFALEVIAERDDVGFRARALILGLVSRTAEPAPPKSGKERQAAYMARKRAKASGE
jgi:hypothetical protein